MVQVVGLLVVYFLLHSVDCNPTFVKIGGMFEEAEDEERSFKQAIERVNSELLTRIKFAPIVRKISSRDAFHASRTVCELVEEGAVAIMGPKSPEVSSVVQSTCERLHLPYLSTTPDYGTTKHNYSINLYPNIRVLSQAFLDMVKIWQWKSFTIVYQEDAGLLRYQELLKAVPGFKISLQQLRPGQTYKGLFKQITRTGETNLLLDIPAHLVLEALKITHDLGLMTEYHNYFLTSLDVHTVNLDMFQYGVTNITGYHLVTTGHHSSAVESPYSHRMLGNWMDFRHGRRLDTRPISTRLALLQDAVKLMAKALEDYRNPLPPGPSTCQSPHIWPPGHIIVGSLRMARAEGLTGEVKVDDRGRRTDFGLDVVELKRGGLTKVGTWTVNSGVQITRNYSQLYNEVIETLRNKTLRITTLVNAPYATLKATEDKLTGNDRYEGFCIDIAHELSKLLHFKYEIRLVRDSSYGSKNVQGEWNGMIRELIDREADFAIGDLTITREREEVVDFTMPFLNLGIGIMIRKPLRTAKLFSFLSPLTMEVWIYLCGAYLAVSVLLFLLARFSPYEWIAPRNSNFLKNQFTLFNSFWFTIGSLMQQGCDLSPRALSTRLIASFWWFFTLIMVSSYTANMAALLITERIKTPIDGAEDLSKQSNVQYGCIETGSTRAFFRDSTNEIYTRMYNMMEQTKPSVYVGSMDEGVARVLDGNYALLAESTSLEYLSQRHCELLQVGGLLNSKGYGIATPTGSPYRSLLSNALLRLQEEGTLQLLKDRWWKPKRPSQCLNESELRPEDKSGALDLTKVGGAFVILLTGLGVSCILAIFEFIWKTKKMVSEERKSKEEEE